MSSGHDSTDRYSAPRATTFQSETSTSDAAATPKHARDRSEESDPFGGAASDFDATTNLVRPISPDHNELPGVDSARELRADYAAPVQLAGSAYTQESATPAQFLPQSRLVRRILLVGHDSATPQPISEQLALLGFAVEIAEGGARALRHLQHASTRGGAYDALLIAPDTHGIDAVLLVGRIKAESLIAPLPVILVADTKSRLTPAAAIELGFDGMLQVPVTFQSLEACLTKIWNT